jgi:hypothetical protein
VNGILTCDEQQAAAGDIVLLYGDESEALTHPYLARAWAESVADLRVPAPGQVRDPSMHGRSVFGNREISSLAGGVAHHGSAQGRPKGQSL